MNHRVEILNRFKRFGEPANSIWFIGIEEGATWPEDPDEADGLLRKYEPGHFYSEQGDVFKSPIYTVISKIMVAVSRQDPRNIDGWRAYRDGRLFKHGEDVFQANLYPIGRPRINSWPDHYQDLFGIRKGDLGAYKALVKTNRFPELHSFWQQSSPRATICFGKTFWPEFRELLKAPWKEPDKGDPFIKYSHPPVILTPFFGNGHMGDTRIERLVGVLLELI
ncbi:MAG: hypothetical protein ACE5G0_01045 [Rhodothermales bacterium]